jgi:hypothetical protein
VVCCQARLALGSERTVGSGGKARLRRHVRRHLDANSERLETIASALIAARLLAEGVSDKFG